MAPKRRLILCESRGTATGILDSKRQPEAVDCRHILPAAFLLVFLLWQFPALLYMVQQLFSISSFPVYHLMPPQVMAKVENVRQVRSSFGFYLICVAIINQSLKSRYASPSPAKHARYMSKYWKATKWDKEIKQATLSQVSISILATVTF